MIYDFRFKSFHLYHISSENSKFFIILHYDLKRKIVENFKELHENTQPELIILNSILRFI